MILQRPLAVALGLVVVFTLAATIENRAQQSTSPRKPLPDGPVIFDSTARASSGTRIPGPKFRVVPTKGLSLPLISAGGSGLVITCAALGLLYSISRHEHDNEEIEAMEPAATNPFDLIRPEPRAVAMDPALG